MQILYLADIRTPTEKRASTLQVLQMCEAFSEQGHEIKLLNTSINSSDPFQYYEIEKKFTIENVITPISIAPYAVRKKLPNLIKMLVRILSLRLHIFFYNYDVIYTRMPLAGIFFKHSVIEIHVLPKKSWTWFFHRVSLRRASSVVTISNSLRDDLERRGIQKDKILVAPDGVNTEKFCISLSKNDARKELSVPIDEHIALFTGHFSATGVRNKFKFLAEIALFLPESIKLYAVGGKDSDILKFEDEMKKNQNLKILCTQPHKAIPLWQKAADVLVMYNPSENIITREYTSPMKLFEYMASGRPIAASDIPSNREILNDTNAFFVSENTPRAFAAEIQNIFNQEGMGIEKGQKAKEDAEQYTWKGRAKKIIHFIENYEK